MIYEFLYRGPTESNDGKPAFHVILGEEVEAFGVKTIHTRGPLNVTQAEKEGYTLDIIAAEINAAALKDNEALGAQVAEQIETISATLAAKNADIKLATNATANALQSAAQSEAMLRDAQRERDNLTASLKLVSDNLQETNDAFKKAARDRDLALAQAATLQTQLDDALKNADANLFGAQAQTQAANDSLVSLQQKYNVLAGMYKQAIGKV